MEDNSIINILVGGGLGLAGTAFGWLLNVLSDRNKKKLKHNLHQTCTKLAPSLS